MIKGDKLKVVLYSIRIFINYFIENLVTVVNNSCLDVLAIDYFHEYYYY